MPAIEPRRSDRQLRAGIVIAAGRLVIQLTVRQAEKMYPFLLLDKAMISAKQHPPVLLLLGERTQVSDTIDKWLAESRYSAFEAMDVFQALEQVSDFTLGDRPDVIYLHSDSAGHDARSVHTIVTSYTDESEIPIIDFEDGSLANDEELEKAIAGLICQLDEFIPIHQAAKA